MRKVLRRSELIAVNVLFCEGDKLNMAIKCINKSEGTNAVATTTLPTRRRATLNVGP